MPHLLLLTFYIRASCLILLQTIPGNVDVTLLKQFILQKFPGILALHEVNFVNLFL